MPALLPDVVAISNTVYAQFSKVYATRGLEAIMRPGAAYHDDYQEFLINLATRLIDVAERIRLRRWPSAHLSRP